MKDQTTSRSETAGGVADHVASLAAGLLELGFSAGDVVCLWCSNYVEYWLVCLAVWELGGVTLPVNCLISLDKLVAQMQETGVSILVCDPFNVEDGKKLREKVESLKNILVIGQVSYNLRPGISNSSVNILFLLSRVNFVL